MRGTHLPIARGVRGQRWGRCPEFVMGAVAGLIVLLLGSSAVMGQSTDDTVFIQRAGSEKTSKRRGTIIEWKGGTLTIETNGTERDIDGDEIVKIQTQWSESYLAGVILLNKGDAAGAIGKLQAALESESRRWAKRMIRAHLVDAFQTANRPGAAVDQFLKIIEEDPNSRYLYLAPLPWTGSGGSLDRQAQRWIASREPVVQLIGASWLLGGPHRDEGIKVLGGLARDIDPRIKNFAIAQLWRTRTNINSKQVEVWHELVKKMPRPLQAGPYLIVAGVQSRTGKADQALISWLRLPILFPEQRLLAAAALYRAAQLLQKRGQSEQAQILLNELTIKYPQSIWAQQSPQRLNH